ncbi:MAG: LptA/OstA family protein [Acidobacteriota bacterium]
MRLGRWLILAALLVIVVFVLQTYIKRQQALAREAPAAPRPLETGINGRASDWVYTQSDGEHPRVTVRAKSFRQVKAPSVMELEGVELQLFHQGNDRFDLVRSAKAQFDIAAKTLYADGDVDITMARPAAGKPTVAPKPGANGDAEEVNPGGRIVKIRTSGVRFASDTGRASTGRHADFDFEQGNGSADGVDYDPLSRELHLRSKVALHWMGKGKRSKPMLIEAGEAYYREMESKVFLLPWSKLTRDTLHMEGASSVISLDDGVIKQAVSEAAHGVQEDPGRKVEFAADSLVLTFGDDMAIQEIKGQHNGKLISSAATMRTTVTGEIIDLQFDPAARESTLTHALAMQKAVAEAQPLPQTGELLADTRVLRSEVIHLNMRPGGKDIDTVETDGAGTVDFLPNRPGQPKRFLQGDRIWITYGPENRIQSFRATNASTRTDKPGTPPPPPMLTQSKELLAIFDPKTSELIRLEQKMDFRYQEGVRRATADRATLEQAKDTITLEGSARTSDPTGTAAADRLVLNQKSGDFVADGRVSTTRQPDQKPSFSSSLLSDAELMQGRAQHMTSAEKNQKLHYEGNAVVWQGVNRVEADRIDIDRTRQVFDAHGKVVSQFADKAAVDQKDEKSDAKTAGNKPEAGKAPAVLPVFTVVRAADLTYSDDTRIAHYQGGATMVRPGMVVNGKELKAYLNDRDADTSLNHAFADGAVKIVSTADKRTRTGTGEHGEYYAAERKVILNGGDALLVDSLKGQTRGNQLTWWSNNDRLLVNGADNRPADTLYLKK